MHTVARFWGPSATAEELLDIGQSLNAVRWGIFRGLGKQANGFTCDVCMDSSRSAREIHAREMVSFISEFGECIRRARASGMSVKFDVAIEPEDRGSAAVYSFTFQPDVLLAISSAGVALEISIY
jgi:hypothetical protein